MNLSRSELKSRPMTSGGSILRTLGPLVVTGLLSVAFFGSIIAMNLGPDHTLVRYTMGHWIEEVEVIFFFWGMSILGFKLLDYRAQRRSLDFRWFADSNEPIAPHQAVDLIQQVMAVPSRFRQTIMGRRLIRAIYDVADRQASEHLDGYMKDLADQDADECHQSFALPRVIAWAIPILGFLGTVIGITIAIANITPTQLEESLPEVTAGLAVAFDTTALALTLSMGLIFAIFVVERMEQSLLSRIDAAARRWLGHRFLASSQENAPYLNAVQAASLQVIQHTRSLVESQTDLWSKTLSALHERLDQALALREKNFADVMKKLLDESRRDTAHFDAAQKRTEDVQARLTRLAELLAQRTGEERALIAAQDRLSENLRMLRQTQSFDEALHSLTAAVHLLTVRAHQVSSDRPENRAA